MMQTTTTTTTTTNNKDNDNDKRHESMRSERYTCRIPNGVWYMYNYLIYNMTVATYRSFPRRPVADPAVRSI